MRLGRVGVGVGGGKAQGVEKREIWAPVSALTLNLSQSPSTSLSTICITNGEVFGTQGSQGLRQPFSGVFLKELSLGYILYTALGESGFLTSQASAESCESGGPPADTSGQIQQVLLQRLQAALLQPTQEVAVHLQQVVCAWEQAADGLGAELQLLPQGPGVDLEHDLERPHMVGLRLHQL